MSMIKYLTQKLGETVEILVENDVYQFHITGFDYSLQPYQCLAYVKVKNDGEYVAIFGTQKFRVNSTIEDTFFPAVRNILKEYDEAEDDFVKKLRMEFIF